MSPTVLAAADISRLETLHQDLLNTCLRLEEAACEPGIQGELRELAGAIPPLLEAVHDLEERLLFPDFDRHAGSCFAAMAIERLKADHRYDRLAANELQVVLEAQADGKRTLEPETIGRMLQGFQEALRRHIQTESLLLEALLAAKSESREIFT
ncbi:hemerythrin domain-containing protein [Rhizobium sp. TRM95111]|uniref:hemerythrin domain-containing protein n=1 Tax=Rhizobium alarense TaxID=2846851 RepID=UPI001F34DEF9|nr:hemerythrin domain-containing protein [Rhizobium alarense]